MLSTSAPLDFLDESVATHVYDYARLKAAIDESEIGSKRDCHGYTSKKKGPIGKIQSREYKTRARRPGACPCGKSESGLNSRPSSAGR